MAWTETTRARYERHSGRYASDLTDQEWGLIAPFLPPPKTTGRPRSTAMRDVLDAILGSAPGRGVIPTLARAEWSLARSSGEVRAGCWAAMDVLR